MTIITAQDVFDRAKKAMDEYEAANYSGGVVPYEKVVAAGAIAYSWKRVADRVRAGEDPIIAVMSRE